MAKGFVVIFVMI